jgi:chloramphenicol O-acetyltransferase
MSADGESYEARPFLKIRRAYPHNVEASRRKNFIHGLVEMDVTEIRRAVRLREAADQDISFTAAVMHAVARVVDEDRIVHTHRRRGQLILFDDVDVNTQIEVVAAVRRSSSHCLAAPLIRRASRN